MSMKPRTCRQRRVWVFDPANNTDHDAGNLRGRPITPPEWAMNREAGWASPDPEGSGTRGPRRVRAWMIAVCAVAVLAVIMAGLGVRQAMRVRSAMAACESMAAQAADAADDLAELVGSDGVKAAAAVTADQVEDPDTVTALADALDEADGAVRIGSCTVAWYDPHPDRIVETPKQAKEQFESKRRTLRQATDAVVASRDAKTLADAADALRGKTDQAAALLSSSEGNVQDEATRTALSSAVDEARKLLDAGDDAQGMADASAALDQAMAAVNDSVKAKQDADAQAAAEAATAQAAQQTQQSYSGGGYHQPSYTPSYSNGGGTGGSPSGGNSSGGSSSGGGGISFGGGSSGTLGGSIGHEPGVIPPDVAG